MSKSQSRPPRITVTHQKSSKAETKSRSTRKPNINLLKPNRPGRKRAVKVSLLFVLPLLVAGLGFARWWTIPKPAPQPSAVATNTTNDNQILAEQSAEQWAMPLDFNTDQLQIITDLVPVLLKEYRKVPTPEELLNTKRKERLTDFLRSYDSPFAQSEETIQAFLDSKNMRLMLAISFVESTMGKRCYYNNCSGIGGYPPDLRKYDNFAGWVKDFDELLEKRYKGLPIEKFMGLYVQPGSPNWINGVRKVLADLQTQQVD